LGEVRDGGCRDRATQHDSPAHRANAGRERGFEHIAAEPSVFTDDDSRRSAFTPSSDQRNRSAESQREFGRDGRCVGASADAVGSKKLPFGHVGLRSVATQGSAR
jgi:hypothetical protein